MIGTLIIAWILTWFNLDNILVDAINQIFNTEFTVAIYWFIAFIIGVIYILKNKVMWWRNRRFQSGKIICSSQIKK